MLKSTMILLAIVACYNYEIWKMNVKIIFLNGNLQEDRYMTQFKSSESKFFSIKYVSYKSSYIDMSKLQGI